MEIAKIEGTEEIKLFADLLGRLSKSLDSGEGYVVRVAVDGDGAKFKINSSSWSPGYGMREVHHSTTPPDPYSFRLQDSQDYPPGIVISGTASDIHSAMEGAWRLSRHHEGLVDVFDERDGGYKIAEVGVRYEED